ncbi:MULTISPECIES: hypothetical protein [unclassified Azospirillum]|uniref:hypothetical protein n=1 Tax=unclassified Azospirillum TaxID=2630922 RepID=UPI000B759C4D|nr:MULTISPECIES: hypothetical protein [unclassified Azospirillum]SNS16045.1 hypothetical protein SAMN05880556_102249 [Azospirillum sp. RU38E]SNS33323.1 hypothetical protein SAMN05880591_102249 [Azospirillum sp. RU37A]
MASGLRKYAVQKPKGAKWETLSLVDDLRQGQAEFRTAVELHGKTPVRLIQVDFTGDEALADFDWHLIELHDPNKGARPRPTVVAGRERGQKPPKPGRKPPPASPQPATSRTKGPPGPGEKVPVPYKTYVAAFLFGVLAIIVWAVTFKM